MVFRQHIKNCLCVSMGFVIGVVLTAALGAGVYRNGQVASNEEEEIVVAGVSLRVIDVNEPNIPQVTRAISISRHAFPFVGIYLDATGEIVGYGLGDGSRKLAMASFGQERLSDLIIYGRETMPVEFAIANDEPEGWGSVRYVRTTPEYDRSGALMRYRPIGEMYIDIDFDGQFDAKDIYNDQSERLSQWVFMDGGWKCLGTFDPPTGWREPGYVGVNTRTAIYREDGREQHLDFVPGLGWKARADSSPRN